MLGYACGARPRRRLARFRRGRAATPLALRGGARGRRLIRNVLGAPPARGDAPLAFLEEIDDLIIRGRTRPVLVVADPLDAREAQRIEARGE